MRYLNLGLAGLHTTSTLLMGFLVDRDLTKATIPLYSHLPGPRPEASLMWQSTEKHLTNVVVGHLATAFLALAALNHLWIATLGWKPFASKHFPVGRNPVRWLEYSVSASLMHVHVALLSGAMDIHLQALIFGLTMTTMIFGWLGEPDPDRGRPTKSLATFWAGFVPYTYQWLVIFCFFFTAVSRGNPPDFVWAIIFVILLLDLSFAGNMYLYLTDRISFRTNELTYCALSLISKQCLAWINYGGTRSLLP